MLMKIRTLDGDILFPDIKKIVAEDCHIVCYDTDYNRYEIEGYSTSEEAEDVLRYVRLDSNNLMIEIMNAEITRKLSDIFVSGSENVIKEEKENSIEIEINQQIPLDKKMIKNNKLLFTVLTLNLLTLLMLILRYLL